jgi:hypothetical protein
MTPKEKARELVYKFDDTMEFYTPQRFAKQCALIAVDEIIQVFWDTHNEDNLKIYSYYQQVKQEIEKL